MCTISGLTVGNFYELQIWTTDDRGGPGWRTSDWADTCGAAGVTLSGHSVTGIFLATSASETFCNGPQQGSSYNLINMIQVRDVSAPPEYQVNGASAGLDINGVQGTSQAAAAVSIPIGASAALNLASQNVGQQWDLGAGAAPLILSNRVFLSYRDRGPLRAQPEESLAGRFRAPSPAFLPGAAAPLPRGTVDGGGRSLVNQISAARAGSAARARS